jgi:RNA polymerase-binding protein DksA
MSETTLKGIENYLRQRKEQLITRLEKVQQDVTAEHSADWVEQAQERQNDEVMDAIGNESRVELSRINQALERLERGEYTTCSQCGETINLQRLEAVPYTDLCIQCASAAD